VEFIRLSAGTFISIMSSVIAIAKTPSENISIREFGFTSAIISLIVYQLISILKIG